MPRKAVVRAEKEIKIFTAQEISRGISKLERRINEVRCLDPREIAGSEGMRDTTQNLIRDTVREIFGEDSLEAADFWSPSLYAGDGQVGYWDDDGSDDWKAYGRGIRQMEIRLRGLITKLEEKRLDLEESPEVQGFELFKGMRLHPRIAGVCTDLFRDGHYPQAVFDAAKALINCVKEKSGRHDLDGKGLMTTVFSAKAPVLAFNSMSDQSDRDEQEGMMHLFEGAVQAVRNPRGHSFLTDSPEEALEFIGLLSLLANRLEKTTKL